jgi:anti-sigma factor (TIGR02949 family)
MKPCDGRSIELMRYLDHDLSELEARRFRDHLNTCPDCQDRLRAEQALSNTLRESRPLFSTPEKLRNELLESIERHSAGNRSRWKWWRHPSRSFSSWRILAPASLVIALCLIAVPNIVQNVRAENYLDTAIENHDRYLNHDMILGIRTNSPDAVTSWFADKLPFHFRLPNSEAALDANPSYKLAGASLVKYQGIPAAMVVYDAPSGIVSLLVESSKVAAVAGGDEVHFGSLIFHYRNDGRFKVITWSAHNVSYALVSSISGSAQESCMVCHQSMRDHGQFRGHP